MNKIKRTVTLNKSFIKMVEEKKWDLDMYISAALLEYEWYESSSIFAKTVYRLADDPAYEIIIRKK